LGFLRDAAKSSEPDSDGAALGALNSLDTLIEALRARGELEGAEREAAGFVLAIAEEARQRVPCPEDVRDWKPPPELRQAEAEVQQQRDAEREEFQRLLVAPCRTIRQLGEWSREAFAWLTWLHDYGPYWLRGESRDPQYFGAIASKAWVEATRLTTREVSEMLDASTQPCGVFRCVEVLQRLRDLAEWCENHPESQRAKAEECEGASASHTGEQGGAGQVEGAGAGDASDQDGVDQGEGDDGEGLSDRQRSILETMLENEITSQRRRKTCAAIVQLVNRTHNASSYTRDFAGLVRRKLLQSREGAGGGVWVTPQRKDEVQRLLTSN
jgi:hypothetical protein